MPKQIVKSALSALIAIGISHIAIAETPPEVAESYEAYKFAVLSLNQEKAEQSALVAWEAAEETLGATRTTGDLAQNYADIAVVTKSNYNKIRNAYKRSIKLASLYPEEEALMVRMERTISLASISRRRDLNSHPMQVLINKTIRNAEAANIQAKTLLADLYTFQAIQSYDPRFRTGSMRLSAERAVTLYGAAQDGLYSPYREYAEQIASCENCDPLFPSGVGAPKFDDN